MMCSSRLSLKELLSIGPLSGRENDEDPPNTGTGGPTGENDENPPDDDEDSNTGDQGGDPEAKIRALTEERQRHYERRQEAERLLAAANEKLQEFERKDKSELENAQTDVQQLTEENGTLKSTVRKLALDNAFLAVNDITWHNPTTALRLADLSEVSMDDDGNVDTKALKAAMKKLADENPYLVKKAEDPDTPPTTRTGNPSSGSTKQSQREKDARARLLQDYPSLRQHVG